VPRGFRCADDHVVRPVATLRDIDGDHVIASCLEENVDELVWLEGGDIVHSRLVLVHSFFMSCHVSFVFVFVFVLVVVVVVIFVVLVLVILLVLFQVVLLLGVGFRV
jgi:hypothetical protein